MHSIFIVIGLIFIGISEFLDVAWMKGSTKEIKITLTFTGKYCSSIEKYQQEECSSLKNCTQSNLCLYENYLPLMSGLIIGFSLTSILLNLIIAQTITKIGKNTLQILNIIDIIQNSIPSLVTLFVFVCFLILKYTQTEWNFQIAITVLLVFSICSYIISQIFLIKTTIPKRNQINEKGEYLINKIEQ